MLRQVFHNQGVVYSAPWSLDLDFLTEKFDQRIGFSRPTADTRIGPTGLLETVPAGVPVIDYHPVTLACMGLRVQEQRTNLLTYSEQFDNAAWGKGAACVVTPNSAIAPDGTLSADTIASSGTQASDNRTQQFAALAVSAGTVVTFSVWLRADSPVTTTLRVANLGDGDGSNAATNVTAQWQRFTVTQTFTGSSTQVRSCINSQGAAVTLYAWGAQLEVGAFATSYIPTATAQATRAADVATMPLAAWFNPVEGTLVVEGRTGGGSVPCFVSIEDGTTANRIQLRRASSDTAGSLRVVSVSGSIDAIQLSGSAGAVNRLAAAFKAGDQMAAVNGVLFAGIPPVASMPSVTQMVIGSGSGSVSINGHLRRLRYYPRRLPNAQLRALTA